MNTSPVLFWIFHPTIRPLSVLCEWKGRQTKGSLLLLWPVLCVLLITSQHICQNTHVCRPLLRVSCVYHGFEHLALHVLLIALLVDAGFPYNVQRWAYVLGMRPAMGQAGWKEIRDGAFFMLPWRTRGWILHQIPTFMSCFRNCLCWYQVFYQTFFVLFVVTKYYSPLLGIP